MALTILYPGDLFKVPTYITCDSDSEQWFIDLTEKIKGKTLRIISGGDDINFRIDIDDWIPEGPNNEPDPGGSGYWISYDELKTCQVCNDWNCETVLE